MLTFEKALQSCCIGSRSKDADSSKLSCCNPAKAMVLLLLLLPAAADRTGSVEAASYNCVGEGFHAVPP